MKIKVKKLYKMGACQSNTAKDYDSVRLSRCQVCGHMVDPNMNDKIKDCKHHIGGLPNIKTKKQQCINCKRYYALEDIYSDGCTSSRHIFHQDMLAKIRKRDQNMVDI